MVSLDINIILPFASSIVGVIVGGLITYFVELKIHGKVDSEKLKDDVYYPLLDNLNDIKNQVFNFQDWMALTTWENIKGTYMKYHIPKKLRLKIAEFVEHKLRNFNVTIDTLNKMISEISKKELAERKINKQLAESVVEYPNPIPITIYPPYLKLTGAGSTQMSNLILRFEESGGYSGSSYLMPEYFRQDFETLKRHYDFGALTVDEFVKLIYSKIKDHELFKKCKKDMKEILEDIDELIKEIQSKTGEK